MDEWLDLPVDDEGREINISNIIAVLLIISIFAFIVLSLRGILPRLAVVQTTSMVPTLKPGDLILIEKVDPSTIRIGDIIAFNVVAYPGENNQPTVYRHIFIVTHRVIDILRINNTLFFKTKGDNNPEPDPWLVPASGVLGKVYKVVSLGRLGLALTRPMGRALLALLVLSTFMILWDTMTSYRRGTSYDLNKYI